MRSSLTTTKNNFRFMKNKQGYLSIRERNLLCGHIFFFSYLVKIELSIRGIDNHRENSERGQDWLI